MLPALLLLGIGRRRRVWIPFLLILMWPFWLLGWAVWLVLRLFRAPAEKPLRMGLMALYHTSGLRVELESADGRAIRFKLI